MLHRFKDLPVEHRHAVEALLGRAVSEDESVSIKAVPESRIVPSTLTEAERKDALERMQQYFAKVDAGRNPDVSAEEERAIINEALRSARPSYRPID